LATTTIDPAPVRETTKSPVSFLEVLHRMSPAERLAAYRHGGFTPHERSLWAARYAEEVPMVNDEFEWIALSLADLD
jgi:hypothetical protein